MAITNRSVVHWTKGGPVDSRVDEGQLSEWATHSVATAADPLPLGLAALATALVTCGALLATWFRPTGSGMEAVLPGVLIFGGLIQLLAAMWAYRRNDLFGATAFGTFGGFFGIVGVLGLAAHPLFTSHQFGPLGVLICCFGLIAVFLAIAGWKLGATLFGTYGLLAISLFLMGATLIGGLNVATLVASGWAAVAAGLIGFYLAGAYLINSYYGKSVVPLKLTERRLQVKLVVRSDGSHATPTPTAG
ncbi:MAG: acetate uptake transporter [bacterium]|jgi:succinate-acetate transporter protein|nr:acetate uptake transporter [bacterium]